MTRIKEDSFDNLTNEVTSPFAYTLYKQEGFVMFKYKKEIIGVFKRLDELDDCSTDNDYFLMQVGMQELLRACGYDIEPDYDEGWVLKKCDRII